MDDVPTGKATMTIRKFRDPDNLWVAAGERAAAEGTNVSALIRTWLEDYISGGEGNANRSKVRLTQAEIANMRLVIEDSWPDRDALILDLLNKINEGR